MSVKIRKKKLKNGRQSIYLDIYHNGKRQYEVLKLYLTKGNSKQERALNKEVNEMAKSIRAKREIALNAGEYGLIPKFNKNANFISFLEEFAKKQPDQNNHAKCAVNHLKKKYGKYVPFKKVNETWLEEARDYIKSQVSANTAYGYFYMIKAALKDACKKKIINSNPALNVDQVKKKDSSREYLTLDEIKMLEAVEFNRKDLKEGFIFSCYTGLRFSDLVRVKWQDIRDDKLHYTQYKTKKAEVLPLTPKAKKILEAIGRGEDDDLVFDLYTSQYGNELLKKWAKKAGVKKNISFHVARHTFATLGLTFGVDLFTISKLLGHAEIKTTQQYAKIIDATKDAAVNKFPE